MFTPSNNPVEWAPLAPADEIERVRASRRRLLFMVKIPLAVFILVLLLVDHSGLIDLQGLWQRVLKSVICIDESTVLGFRLLMYGFFLLPMLFAWVFIVWPGRSRDLARLQARQDPLPGETVTEPTRIQKGFPVLLGAVFRLCLLTVLPALILSMAFTIEDLAYLFSARDIVKLCSGI